MFDRQLWRRFDWPLMMAVLALSLIGIAMIYSATVGTEELTDYWRRQSFFLLLGIAVLVAIAIFDYRHLEVLAPPIFVIFVGSLILVSQIGTTQGTGSQRWIEIGGTTAQPTEAGKFLLVVFMAWYLSRFRDRRGSLIYLLGALTLLLGPLILVYLQPDLGMTITMAFIGGVLILVNGVYYWQLSIAALMGLIAVPFLRNTLSGYMLARICIFLNEPALVFVRRWFDNLPLECIDPEVGKAASYNVDQALIAVGSGGLLGRGWSLGSQNQLFFLRVRHTDFIFSVIAEELGLAGSILILFLLFFVVWRLLKIASLAQDHFGRLLATGVAAVIFFQVVVNVGMNISIVPVTGLTLPFVSYGGSSLISMMFAVGLAQSVAMRHKRIDFL